MFLDNKYTRWYFSIVENAKSQNRIQYKRQHKLYTTYYETHHIIPKCMGGLDTTDNTVVLLAKEHYILHLLLCRMTTGNIKHKMINALIRMQYSKSDKQERYNSRSFSLIRKLIAEKNSEATKGVPKSKQMRERVSKTKTGMKFSDSHRANISKSVIARNLTGERNPFYGKKHTPEIKEIMIQNLRNAIVGNQFAKGKIWVTNQIIDKMVYPDNIPIGFVKGRSQMKNKIKVGGSAYPIGPSQEPRLV